MEQPKKEETVVTETFTEDVIQSSSTTTETETSDDPEIVSENMQCSTTSNTVLSESQSNSVQHLSTSAIINLETVNEYHEISHTIESRADTFELSKNGETEKTTTESEITEVTKKYQEYIPVSQPQGQNTRATEYESAFNLENTYITGISSKVENLGQIQENNLTDQVDQQNTPVPHEYNESDNNFESAYLTEHRGSENWSHDEQSSHNRSDKDVINNQLTNSSIEGNAVNTECVAEVENENVDEKLVHENVANEVEGKDNYDSCDVKAELNSMEVDVSDPVISEEQMANDNVNEPIAQEQNICSNEEMVENDLATQQPDVSVENYTITDAVEVTEIQGEYTIVEGPSSLDISTNQLDESGNTEETWVLLENHENSEDSQLEITEEEQNELYLSELRSEAESRQSIYSQSSETSNKPRRGRKPTYDIPMHVLGHDISKPAESVSNGRALPKPRLGVKVPYRNLTSQIVSKAEIEKEVMERARLKQEQAGSRADVLFARKLTQRLARKIAPSPDPSKKLVESKKSKETASTIQRKEVEPIPEKPVVVDNSQSQDNSKIHNDSDLLAILEGEGDDMPVLPKEVPQPQIDDSNLKMLEREIALQQLQELPNQAPKHRIYRGRVVKSEINAPILTAETPANPKDKTGEPALSKPKDHQVLSDKENESRCSISIEVPPKHDQCNIEATSSPRKQPIEIEPQVKVNMVLKTYSRKRKTVDIPGTPEGPISKKPMLSDDEIKVEKMDNSGNAKVYVTKSSRVIKKKVIWDPDETPTRSPKCVVKLDPASPKTSAVKLIKPGEKAVQSSTTEKSSEKKSISEKLPKEKTEKKSNEKGSLLKKSGSSPNEKKILKNDAPKIKTPVKPKKTRSEVDKLLMDEGAVKMLYDLKNTDETVSRKKKDVYSVEKAHKEIMKKANEIKSDLQLNTSSEAPKSLRKKDSFTPSPVKAAQIAPCTERKMSKDSTRSSIHTPPGSPAYSFPHSQSSMLIRRRSSSSISSSDEANENDTLKISRKKSLSSSDAPKPKKNKKTETTEPSEKLSEVQVLTEKSTPIEHKLISYKTFTVKRVNKHITIDLNYNDQKCYCTIQVLEELTMAIKKFSKDKDCNVLCITSNPKAFCLGLDYTFLISDKEDVRKQNATELAEKIREFLMCLLKFPKVLIAGIQGDCVGLGVTMLPLFDMVIASDTATFSTNYAHLGCVPEAGFLLSPPFFSSYGLAADLLYNTQQIKADDAFRRGLVTRLCWPEKYNDTLKNILVSVSRGSKQSLMATKKQLRRHLLHTAEVAINSESKLLVEHWTSLECQKNFAQINKIITE